MSVWITCSSMLSLKAISAFSVLIVQICLVVGSIEEDLKEKSCYLGSVTGTMVNMCSGIRKALP
jgi:hypothetical protein